MKKDLFEPTSLGSMTLKNRFFCAAIGNCQAYEGFCCPEDFSFYEDLAKGEVSTIITGLTVVADYSMVPSWGMYRLDSDEHLADYQRLTRKIQGLGTNLIMQLVHCGSNAYNPNITLYAPSAVPNLVTKMQPQEMSGSDIQRIKRAFVQAAGRAQQAGFAGIELHAAHGYLLSEFLTPYYNRRTDQYGGSDENRARFLVEICQETRQLVGATYPILVKINSSDAIAEGITPAGLLTACLALEQAGASAIEVSGNWLALQQTTPYYLEAASQLALILKIPVILVGQLRKLEAINDILQRTSIDYFSLARPLICQPDLIRLWHHAKTNASLCTSCNSCVRPDGSLHCIQRPERLNAHAE